MGFTEDQIIEFVKCICGATWMPAIAFIFYALIRWNHTVSIARSVGSDKYIKFKHINSVLHGIGGLGTFVLFVTYGYFAKTEIRAIALFLVGCAILYVSVRLMRKSHSIKA